MRYYILYRLGTSIVALLSSESRASSTDPGAMTMSGATASAAVLPGGWIGQHLSSVWRRLVVAAQVEIESNIEAKLKQNCMQFIIIWFLALRSRRFQRGFDRVNLHHLTLWSRQRR